MDNPWDTSKLFFRPDLPGQAELRDQLRAKVFLREIDLEEATRLMWK